jgi:hypothetical protein
VTSLRVVIVKPSKYDESGSVERFRRGFMPNSTVPYMASMTPREVRGAPCEVHAVDEYVQTDLDYLSLFAPDRGPSTRRLRPDRTRGSSGKEAGAALFAVSGFSAISRMASARGLHPMAGGIGRVRKDRAADYSELRRRTFGIDRAPPLSRADEEINRRAKLGA